MRKFKCVTLCLQLAHMMIYVNVLEVVDCVSKGSFVLMHACYSFYFKVSFFLKIILTFISGYLKTTGHLASEIEGGIILIYLDDF